MKNIFIKCKTCKHVKYTSTDWVDEMFFEARDMIDIDKVELLRNNKKLKCSKCGSKDIVVIIIKEKVNVISNTIKIKTPRKRIKCQKTLKSKKYLDILLNIIENKKYLYINEIDKVVDIKNKIAINGSLEKSDKEFINNIYDRILHGKKNVFE